MLEIKNFFEYYFVPELCLNIYAFCVILHPFMHSDPSNQEFQVETREEQEIADHCKRLIENAVICWNYIHLTKKVAALPRKKEQKQLIDNIKNGSIVYWKHINALGEYDFSDKSIKEFHLSTFPKIPPLKVA